MHTELVAAAGGWRPGVEVYRRAWQEKFGAPLEGVFAPGVAEVLPPELTQYLQHVAREGAPSRQETIHGCRVFLLAPFRPETTQSLAFHRPRLAARPATRNHRTPLPRGIRSPPEGSPSSSPRTRRPGPRSWARGPAGSPPCASAGRSACSCSPSSAENASLPWRGSRCAACAAAASSAASRAPAARQPRA